MCWIKCNNNAISIPLNPATMPIIRVTKQRIGKAVGEPGVDSFTINHQLYDNVNLHHAIEKNFLQVIRGCCVDAKVGAERE